MAQVDVRINGYSYTLGCADGEEEHLRAMAAQVEATVGVVKAAGGAIGEARTLVMVALLLADRVADLEAGAPVIAPPQAAPAPDPALVARLAHAAAQAERIADTLEAA